MLESSRPFAKDSASYWHAQEGLGAPDPFDKNHPSKAGNRKAQRRPGFVRDFEGSRTGSSKLLGLGARRELQP